MKPYGHGYGAACWLACYGVQPSFCGMPAFRDLGIFSVHTFWAHLLIITRCRIPFWHVRRRQAAVFEPAAAWSVFLRGKGVWERAPGDRNVSLTGQRQRRMVKRRPLCSAVSLGTLSRLS